MKPNKENIPAIETKPWVDIDDINVIHVWRDNDGNEVEVSPDFYEENGEPIDENGDDMTYIKTMVRL